MKFHLQLDFALLFKYVWVIGNVAAPELYTGRLVQARTLPEFEN